MKKYKATKNIPVERLSVQKSVFKSRRFLWILAGLIIVLMVGSVLVMMFEGEKDNGNTFEFNGHKFILDPQKGWITKVNGQDVGFEFLPFEVNNLSRPSFFGLGLGKTYVTFNPSEFSDRSYEVSRLIAFLTFTGRQAFAACTNETGCADLPVINCSQDTSDNIVYIYLGNETRIEQENGCLKLEAKPGDELKVVSLFIYQLLGIIK